MSPVLEFSFLRIHMPFSYSLIFQKKKNAVNWKSSSKNEQDRGAYPDTHTPGLAAAEWAFTQTCLSKLSLM